MTVSNHRSIRRSWLHIDDSKNAAENGEFLHASPFLFLLLFGPSKTWLKIFEKEKGIKSLFYLKPYRLQDWINIVYDSSGIHELRNANYLEVQYIKRHISCFNLPYNHWGRSAYDKWWQQMNCTLCCITLVIQTKIQFTPNAIKFK